MNSNLGEVVFCTETPSYSAAPKRVREHHKQRKVQ